MLSLLLKELRSSAQIDELAAPTSNNEYSICVNFVVDTVMLCFGSPHSKKSLVEVELSLISMNSNALLSESGVVPGSEDQNQINFRSNLSAQYLNTSHGFMESLISPYPTYGSVSYALELNNDGSESKLSYVMLGIVYTRVNLNCPSPTLSIFHLRIPRLSTYAQYRIRVQPPGNCICVVRCIGCQRNS